MLTEQQFYRLAMQSLYNVKRVFINPSALVLMMSDNLFPSLNTLIFDNRGTAEGNSNGIVGDAALISRFKESRDCSAISIGQLLTPAMVSGHFNIIYLAGIKNEWLLWSSSP